MKKIYLVKRSTMCLEESKGGLAIQRLSLLNKVFLYKWIWRFATKRCAFWTQVIKGKYGEEECGWWSGEVRDGYRVGLWKSITKEQSTFLGHFSFMVGNGRRVKFSTNKWCGYEPLCVSFHSLYVLVDSKEAWMANLWVKGERALEPLFLSTFE